MVTNSLPVFQSNGHVFSFVLSEFPEASDNCSASPPQNFFFPLLLRPHIPWLCFNGFLYIIFLNFFLDVSVFASQVCVPNLLFFPLHTVTAAS
jgi:hypothetical protein